MSANKVGTCRTCRHWSGLYNPFFSFGDDAIIGSCRNAVKFWEARDYDGNKLIIKPEYRDAKVFVQDGEDYSASMHTRIDFGCVDHALDD